MAQLAMDAHRITLQHPTQLSVALRAVTLPSYHPCHATQRRTARGARLTYYGATQYGASFTMALLAAALVTMALLTVDLLTVDLLTVALLTMALLTMALLTMALLTMAPLLCALWLYSPTHQGTSASCSHVWSSSGSTRTPPCSCSTRPCSGSPQVRRALLTL